MPTRALDLVETLHGHPVPDPYRWLEDGDADEVRAWVAAQNAATRAVLDPLPLRPALRHALDRALEAGAVGPPTARGGRLFYTRRDGRQDQPVLVVRDAPDAAERVLLDPAAFGSSLVSLDWWYPSPDGRRVAYGTSTGGDERSTLRVRDVETGADLPGEAIPHTRLCSVAWVPDEDAFYYTRLPEPGTVPPEDEPYFRHVYFHRLGQDWRADPRVFGEGRAREDWPHVHVSPDGRWVLIVVSQGWARTEVFLLDRRRPEAGLVPVQVGVDAIADGEVAGGSLYLRSNDGAPNYRVVRVDPEHPERTAWREVVPERPDAVIDHLSTVAGRLVLDELRDATSRLGLYGVDGQPGPEVRLPDLATLTGVGGEWSADDVFVGTTSFGTPPAAYRVDPRDGSLRPVAAGAWPAGHRPAPHVVRQVWFPSRDGTRVSMFLVHRPDLPLDGDNPTLLTGYGGFNISRTPAFDASLQPWLAAGGVFALPNLRGGGEYGEAWHRDGMLARKQHVFDDFLAAADWLVANGYTRPRRLGISGGSNGGLLVGAALTQRPDLFQAVVCRVPLLDMLRFHCFGPARLWVAEYGNPDEPEAFGWLRLYSPYHQVRDGERYPAVLLMAAEQDTRVDPLHARKMAARLQAASASGLPVLLRIESAAGHGQGKPRGKVLDEQTDLWSFLFWQLGVAPPPAGAAGHDPVTGPAT